MKEMNLYLSLSTVFGMRSAEIDVHRRRLHLLLHRRLRKSFTVHIKVNDALLIDL